MFGYQCFYGAPVLTDFGVKAFIDIDSELQVPEEWGSGTWKDGISALNYKAINGTDLNTETGMCYSYVKWDDYVSRTETALSKDWTEHTGYNSAIDYFKDLDLLAVIPGTTWAVPEYTTDINTIREQCKQTIIECSWRMCFAGSDEEFASILKEMQDTVKGLGYDEVLAVDEQNCRDRYALFVEAWGE
ncbi:hypothetical protein LJC58_03630 [Lachnospiraceae bacterium OttesenSCG-928-D06]|nr:hypothetical protein [Lachnospiraceae bacterium OttesenSCG-928-D06]